MKEGSSGVEACITARPDGISLAVKARPSAGRTRVTGFDAARGELSVDVGAPPEGGKATRELARFLKRLLCASGVEVLKGQADRHKVFLVSGVSSQDALRIIRGVLDEA